MPTASKLFSSVSSDNNYEPTAYRMSLDLENIRSRSAANNSPHYRRKQVETMANAATGDGHYNHAYHDPDAVVGAPGAGGGSPGIGGGHDDQESRTRNFSMYRSFITVAILCLINLINYMDRYTIAGVLSSILDDYGLSNTEGGFLQTCFIVSYMIMAPVFGYLGDRYSRKWIIIGGVTFWSLTTFLGSLVPKNGAAFFFLLRALVGTGEASYSTIAPTIIADLFTGSKRSRMLAIFYFAIPVGSGLGFIAGSQVAYALDSWRWALRVTPPLGLISVVLMLLFVKEPARGEADGGEHLKSTTIKDDLIDLSKNKSFVWSTLGFTCVTFAAGSLAWWAPTYVLYASKVRGDNTKLEYISVIFGVITCIAGIAGVILGTVGAQFYRRYNARADPLVCAFGLLVSVPFVYIGICTPRSYQSLSWVMIFFGETFLSMNWPIVADMLLYVVIPTRRSMAEAVQILLSHALGDACSPYIIGAVSDAIIRSRGDTVYSRYVSLQYALFIAVFIMVLGGLCFLITAWYIINDKEKCTNLTRGCSPSPTSLANAHDILPVFPPEVEYDNPTIGFSDTQNLIT